jgi:hypothetical protein
MTTIGAEQKKNIIWATTPPVLLAAHRGVFLLLDAIALATAHNRSDIVQGRKMYECQ